MTYAMKIEEERELAEEKGRQEGEGRLLKLVNFLIANGKQDEIERATKDPESLSGMYVKYGIS